MIEPTHTKQMNVIYLTVFVGLILVGLAVSFFAFTRRTAATSSPERDSLMPLEDERVVPEGATRKR